MIYYNKIKSRLYVTMLIGALCGCASEIHSLSEPKSIPCLGNLALKDSALARRIPVAFEPCNRSLNCAVTHVNLIGETASIATFCSGDIVAREFEKVISANFRLVTCAEKPFATFRVDVDHTTARFVDDNDGVEVSVGVSVNVDAIGYSRSFEGKASEVWHGKENVPIAFYRALGFAVGNFIVDCDANGLVRKISDLRQSPEPPSLKSPIQWDKCGYVWKGFCKFSCNDYELEDAKAWAHDYVFEKCWTQLDRISRENVRVVYDNETTESDDIGNNRILRLSFKAFARRPMIYHYDAAQNIGFIIGDMQLMGVISDIKRAELDLKEFVEGYGKTSGRKLDFSRPAIDDRYKLMTITFKIVETS